jgi:hypothetical protein
MTSSAAEADPRSYLRVLRPSSRRQPAIFGSAGSSFRENLPHLRADLISVVLIDQGASIAMETKVAAPLIAVVDLFKACRQ